MADDAPLSAVAGSYSDYAALIEVAQEAVDPTALHPEEVYSVVVPQHGRVEVLELERHLDKPHRSKGTATVETLQSFIDLGKRHESDKTTVWVDEQKRRIVAVLKTTSHPTSRRGATTASSSRCATPRSGCTGSDGTES